MNKADLVKRVSEKAGLNLRQAAAAVDAFTDSVRIALSKKDSVRLVGFGSFETRRRNARKGVVPGTKKPINIPARTVPFFRPGARLKKAVR